MIFQLTVFSLSLLGIFLSKSSVGHKLEAGKLALGRRWSICALDQSQHHPEWQENRTKPFSRLPVYVVFGLLTGSLPNLQKLWVLLEWQEEITDLEMEWLGGTVWVYSLSQTWYNHNIRKDQQEESGPGKEGIGTGVGLCTLKMKEAGLS